MECLSCGASAPADPATGYDGDPLCPRCLADGWELTTDGALVGPDQHPRATVIARVPRRMARAGLRRRSIAHGAARS